MTAQEVVTTMLEMMGPTRKQTARRDFAVADTGKRPPKRTKSYLRKPSVSIEPPATEEEIEWYTRQGIGRVTAKCLVLDRRKGR